MAAAISSYLSACSASLAFCTSCSRSTILTGYWGVALLCSEMKSWKNAICNAVKLNEDRAAAVACYLRSCRRDTLAPLLTLLRGYVITLKRWVPGSWCNNPCKDAQRSCMGGLGCLVSGPHSCHLKRGYQRSDALHDLNVKGECSCSSFCSVEKNFGI